MTSEHSVEHTMCSASGVNTSDRPSLGTSLKPCIRRLIVYTDTLAEWVYGYVDLAWLCLRIRRLGGSCLRILSADTTGIHASPGPSRRSLVKMLAYSSCRGPCCPVDFWTRLAILGVIDMPEHNRFAWCSLFDAILYFQNPYTPV